MNENPQPTLGEDSQPTDALPPPESKLVVGVQIPSQETLAVFIPND